MRTIADLKGKRVAMGYSAMRNIDQAARAMLATAGLTEKDVKPVLVPNVVRSADDFVAGNADMFFFAFGGPKVREADATVGGIRVLEIDETGMPAARKIMPWGYLTEVAPGPDLHRRREADEGLQLRQRADHPRQGAGRVRLQDLDTMEKNKADLVAVQPVLREFSAAFGYKQYGVPYHPGALKYFKERNLTAKPLE